MISRNPRKQNKHEVNSYHNKMNAMAMYILLLLSKAFLLASCENETSTPMGPSKKIEKKTIASGKDSTGDCSLESKYIHSNSKRLSQYLELRFSVGVRMVGCLFFILEYVSSFL